MTNQNKTEGLSLPGIDAGRLRAIALSGSQTAMQNALLNVACAIQSALLSKLRAPIPVDTELRAAAKAFYNTLAETTVSVSTNSAATRDALVATGKRLRAAILAGTTVAGEARPTNEVLWDQTLSERDEYHKMADRLANAIADHLVVEIGEHSSCNCPWMRALEAIENAAPRISDAVRQQHTEDSLLPRYLLASEHIGMRVDYTGLFGWACAALKRGETAPPAAEMLRQLYIHLTELGQRWYSGDSAVVDELLQLYCIESDTRAALAAQPGAQKQENRVGANSGHGHVWKRPDGLVAKCGGPGLCIICTDDKAHAAQMASAHKKQGPRDE